MYHEITYEDLRQQRNRRVRMVVVVALVALVVAFALARAQVQAREQGVATVRAAVLRAATQCCAVEGSYPPSLRVLEERYGLVINERDYHVSYEWLGDNIVPAVVVSVA